MPGKSRQLTRHCGPSTTLAVHQIPENALRRGVAEISQHYGEAVISPAILIRCADQQRLRHEALGLQAIVRMQPERAVLLQREAQPQPLTRWDRRLGRERNAVHRIGQDQPMEVEGGGHRQAVGHHHINAVLACGSVAPLAAGLQDGPAHHTAAEHLHRGGGDLQLRCVGCDRQLKGSLIAELFPGRFLLCGFGPGQ